MAKSSLLVKTSRKPKFKVRGYTRGQFCSRPDSVFCEVDSHSVCVREMAYREPFPGAMKSSW